MTIDKGLKKAIKSQPAYRLPSNFLPSNFTYRMMQQVREEAYARERREEFRLRLALVIFCVCALGGLFYYIIKVYGVALSRMWQALCQSLPSHDTFLFFLPISVSIVCLGVLYWWLDKRMRRYV